LFKGTLNLVHSIEANEEIGMAGRPFHWAIAVSSLAVSFSATEIVSALPSEPNYFCYERTVYGQVINLNSYCKQTPGVSSKNNSGNATRTTRTRNVEPADTIPIEVKSDVKQKLDFSELNFDNGILLGSIRNKSGKAMGISYINFKAYQRKDASNWKLIDTGRARVLDEELKPGKTTSFEGSVRVKADKIVITGAN